MGKSEDLKDAGPWNLGECPRCGAADDQVRWKRGGTLQALRCSGCGLSELGRTDAEAEKDFFKARGSRQLGNHPEIHWDFYAGTARIGTGDKVPETASGTLILAEDDPSPPAGIFVRLSFGYKDGTAGARIENATLRAAALKLLKAGEGRPMADVLKWKLPDRP